MDNQVAVIILNFNSASDTINLVKRISLQQNIHFSIIIVDNNSQDTSVSEIENWLNQNIIDAVIGNKEEVCEKLNKSSNFINKSGAIYFIKNHENKGYSAGNNIGICLGELLGANCVLIVNPDIRIENPSYIALLAKNLFDKESHYIAASRILDLDGKDQNPLREATFWEEFFWPRFYLYKLLKRPISYILPISVNKPVVVPKVSGCCLMLKMTFLKQSNLLDESVFLYCEEPILSAQVKMLGGDIVYVPSLSAVHAHVKSKKANVSYRVLLSIKSRLFYLKRYSGYGIVKLSLLRFSYAVLAMLHHIRIGK